MMKNYVYTLGFILVAAVLGCNSDPVPVSSGNGTALNRQLKITVRNVYDVGPPARDSLLPEAIVSLYENEQDREVDLRVRREGITDEDGLLIFDFIASDVYYLKAVHPDFDQFEYLDEITVEEGALVTYLEIPLVD